MEEISWEEIKKLNRVHECTHPNHKGMKITDYYRDACKDWAEENPIAGFNSMFGKLCFNCKYCKKAY